jgi:hypothetical protein
MRQAAQGPDKAFLYHILGILPMAKHAVTQAKHLALELLDKLHHGRLFAGQTAVNQLLKAVLLEAQSTLSLGLTAGGP